MTEPLETVSRCADRSRTLSICRSWSAGPGEGIWRLTMAIFDDMLKGGIGTGLAVGIGAVVLPPVMGRVLRPVVMTAVKNGLSVSRDTDAALVAATGAPVADARADPDPGNPCTTCGRGRWTRSSPTCQS